MTLLCGAWKIEVSGSQVHDMGKTSMELHHAKGKGWYEIDSFSI